RVNSRTSAGSSRARPTSLLGSHPGVGVRDFRVVRQAGWALLPVATLLLAMPALPADAQEAAKEPAYRAFPLLGSRLAVWAIAQLHLNFAAFILGVPILLVANSWVTFMMSPAGIDESGALKGSVWAAINNYTWMPINIHRLIANIVFGGTIAAAYAAFRFLGATSDEERARYDWMGYVGNFVALAAFIVLPFAGYYLGR